MARYMITHSLLSSWLYSMKENPYEDATTERDAREEFLSTLRREPSETSFAMQKGIDFENLITAVIEGRPTALYHWQNKDTKEIREKVYSTADHPWYMAASQIAKELDGHLLQFKAKREVAVSGMKILLYGRLDGLGAGTITDTKYTSNYEHGKYFDSTQHPMYFELVPEANTFIYTVSNGKDVWHETYLRERTPSIIPTVSAFLDYLTAAGLMPVFKEHWKAL